MEHRLEITDVQKLEIYWGKSEYDSSSTKEMAFIASPIIHGGEI